MTTQPYSTPHDVDRAIKDAASHAAEADPTVSTSKRIRYAWFDRFLCRVFSEGERSEWVLKGGTGVLARVPSARATKDVDLYLYGYSLDSALADLRRLALVDLGDHFRFVYTNHEMILVGNQQPEVEGYRISFEVYLGTRKITDLSVDLCVGPGEAGLVDLVAPANRSHLPRLITHPYRLFPVVNQIADKVCAR